MTKQLGVVIASHVAGLAEGVATLLKESAPEVSITYAGGTDDNGVGSSFEKITAAIEENKADQLYCFYDLGSAKMTLEMCQDFTEKTLIILDVALVEGAYTASALLQGNYDKEAIDKQLQPLTIK